MALASEFLREYDLASSYLPTALSLPQILPSKRDTMDGLPHLVDMSIPISEEVDTTNLRIADSVATFLHLYNPAIMNQFLSLDVPSVFFCRKQNDLYESSEMIIKRDINVVTVGWCTVMMTDAEVIHGMLRKPRLFKDYVTLVKFCIKESGEWTPMSAQDVLTNHLTTNDPNMVELVGSKAARMLLTQQEWKNGIGVTITTSDPLRSAAKPSTLQGSTTGHSGTKDNIFKRAFRKRKTTAAPAIEAHSVDRLAFQTSGLSLEDTNASTTEDSFVDAPITKTQVTEGQNVNKADMGNPFWQARATRELKDQANAMNYEATNAPVTSRPVVANPLAINPIRKSSIGNNKIIEEYEMTDLA
ncbi:hypothetical protein MMC11_001311 [Xylographa trunciseda]|nr:hypothetical protein [Xylographa trunciseda]